MADVPDEAKAAIQWGRQTIRFALSVKGIADGHELNTPDRIQKAHEHAEAVGMTLWERACDQSRETPAIIMHFVRGVFVWAAKTLPEADSSDHD